MSWRSILYLLIALHLSIVSATELPDIGWAPDPIWKSVGFRLGYMLNMKHQWDHFVIWAYEAQLMLGFGASAGPITELHCYTAEMAAMRNLVDPKAREELETKASQDCFLFENPLTLSTYDGRFYEQFEDLQHDKPVVVFYAIPTVTVAGMFTKSKNWIYGIYPTEPDLDIKREFHASRSDIPIAHLANPEVGTIVGRVVQLSVENYFRKTYEAIIQEQENDTNFTAMSVNDTDLFNYLKQAMLTGKPLRISYVRLFGPEGAVISLFWPYHTYYRITDVVLE